MAMTSSRRTQTSWSLAPPRLHVAGAVKPIFHAPCRAYANWWKKYLKSKSMSNVAVRSMRAGGARAMRLIAAFDKVGLLSSTQKFDGGRPRRLPD
eukprot:2582646-Pleurochrysis_carterae.AAC.1